MRRTNIYLPDSKLLLLQLVARERGVPVAALIRDAVDEWLRRNGVTEIPEEERQRRFDELMERRQRLFEERGWTEEEVERDVMEAVREVRRARAARRP